MRIDRPMKPGWAAAPCMVASDVAETYSKSTCSTGVIGETTFDSKGDLKHGVISLYDYKAGKKTLLDVVKM